MIDFSFGFELVKKQINKLSWDKLKEIKGIRNYFWNTFEMCTRE